MTRAELHLFYRKREESFSKRRDTLSENINVISTLRLVVAGAFLVFAYISFSNSAWWGIGAATAVGVFLVLVKKHALLFEERSHVQNLVSINNSEQKVLRDDYRHMNPGDIFSDPHHAYTHDLDIFGQGSLFQYLNRCNTIAGQTQFAHHLAHPLASIDVIRERQKAIADMAPRFEFRQHFQAAGMESGEQPDDTRQLLAWTKQTSIVDTKGLLRYMLYIIPSLTIAAIVTSFFVDNIGIVVTGLVMTQWTITGLYLKKVNVFHDYISRKKNILQRYAKLLQYLKGEKFNAKSLIEISTEANEADLKVTRLASLVSALDARTNFLAGLFVNSILLYDLQCVFRLERWKEDNAQFLASWLQAISDVEEICSYGTYSFNHPGFVYADITSELKINALDLAHPLIDENHRVPSTITMGPAPTVFIITGANMAGKSTFLRTLGVNLVLALNGAPICATKFECPVIQLRSGMRTADSLQDHQSYFYAELNRLKTIMDELRQGKPLLILLDEILKGTNSTDKQAGSMALVKQLLPHPCLAMIATHDLALGDLENQYPREIKNFCFEANIENDQLSFDYKLKPGLATRMNASFLMKKMGIIP
jgi:DNA mismatch repair ATPase MutS